MKCSVSGYPIFEDTKAVLIPIVMDKFSSKLNKVGFKDTIIVNPEDVFQFMGLGIKGTYDGYGSLKDIENDFYYKYYKKLLMKDDETDIDNENFMERLEIHNIQYFYIKREVYDYLVSDHSKEMYDSVYKSLEKDKEILTSMYNIIKDTFNKLKEFKKLKEINPDILKEEGMFKQYREIMSIDSVYSTLQSEMFYLDNNLSSRLHFDFAFYKLEDEYLNFLMGLSENDFIQTLFDLINFRHIIDSLAIAIIPSIYVNEGEYHLAIKHREKINSIIDDLPKEDEF